MYRFFFLLITLALVALQSCQDNGSENPKITIQLTSLKSGPFGFDLAGNNNVDVPFEEPLLAQFSMGIDLASAVKSVTLRIKDGALVPVTLSLSNLNKVLTIQHNGLMPNRNYELIISNSLQGDSGESFKGITISFKTLAEKLQITSLKVDDIENLNAPRIINVSLNPVFEITFSSPIQAGFVKGNYFKILSPAAVPCVYTLINEKTISVAPAQSLSGLKPYQLFISGDILGTNDEQFIAINKTFYTAADPTPKFPVISDEELLTLVQQQTFKYFYDYAEPNSGMARERNGSGNLVTTGGTGFGLMAMIVAIERNFITRQQGIDRLNKIVTFLETADRFHGAWSHWVNGATGKVIPFSTKDNGGDLVETSFLVQGLLTFRQYLTPTDTVGNNLIKRINTLWEGVEWDWYRKNNENVLYWHWSPNYNWDMNFALSGYFEQQITYVLAAASPTHSIPKEVYTNGYGRNGQIKTGSTYYGYTLPLGGLAPLFWVQYSYLGLDPHFSDDYANYWTQNTNATLINYSYCVANPKNYVGYGADCWGLTASDNQSGYNAHSPSNDLGVITPTAALSSFPYSPTESMRALKFFYYTIGDRLWGQYGFYDAFNITSGWTASSYLAIDQGPIIVMIENHRTGLLWNLFMSSPEVKQAEMKLNFIR